MPVLLNESHPGDVIGAIAWGSGLLLELQVQVLHVSGSPGDEFMFE